jgi:hypothetical protein
MVQSALTPAQVASLALVLDGLREVGYSTELIRRNYSFEDWFEFGTPERVVDAAAFSRKPFAYDTACFAVATSNGEAGVSLMRRLRALGAPRSFEVARDGRVFHWRVSQNPSAQDRQGEIDPHLVPAVFASHRDRWSPDAISRQRLRPPLVQSDFIDVGLIPALEEHIRDRLEPWLENILELTTADYLSRTGRELNPATLFRLIFRGIAGKVMRDRNHTLFRGFRRDSDPEELFALVAKHYGEAPGNGDRATRRLIYDSLWSGFNLRNVSVDVLAFLYEDFLVTPDLRVSRGIHATPPSVARYVVNHLPFDDVEEGRTVVEPCCGGAAFLVAGLQRFRQVLPRTIAPAAKHEYARSRLFGADLDAFALEVARYSLMLSDYPSRNGWQLEIEDVFSEPGKSPKYHEALSRAKIVLCNTPFEDMNPAVRSKYGARTPRTPAELILRVLDRVPRDACLGFVLPTQAVDGKSYSEVRRQLASRFAELELIHLPDDAFKHAELPAVLLIARQPESGHSAVRITSGTVLDMPRFTRTGVPDDRFTATRSADEAAHSLDVTRFWKAWKELGVTEESRSLEPHRGVEWKSTVPAENRTSDRPQDGFRPGYHSTGEIALYEAAALVYLNASPGVRDRNAWDLPWHLPKVFLNTVRASRGPWRLAAFPVYEDRACTENFIAIWPPKGWTANALSAVLNGPVAAAFVATHDRDRHNKTMTLAKVPLPALGESAIKYLDRAVRDYIDRVATYRQLIARRTQELTDAQSAGLFVKPPPISPEPSAEPLRELILGIDNTVLAGYGLTPPIERDIVNFFRGEPRPLPFAFEDYESRLIRLRLNEQTKMLDEHNDEQRDTWEFLKRELDEERRSSRKLFS